MYFTFGHKLSIKILFVTETNKFTRLMKSALTFTSSHNKEVFYYTSKLSRLFTYEGRKKKSPSVFIDTNNSAGVKIELDC